MKRLKLRFLGASGPNGEKKDEVRDYPEDVTQMYLQTWPNNFELLGEVQERKKADKKARSKDEKSAGKDDK